MCSFFLLFLFPTWARAAYFGLAFVLYCSFFSSDIEHIFFWILTHSLCLNFTFIFEYSTHSSSVLGRVCVQSIPSGFGTLWFVLHAPDAPILSLSQSYGISACWLFGFTSYYIPILFCSVVLFLYASAVLWLIRIPLGYSPHTSISALNIRSSLFFLVLHSGGWVFFRRGWEVAGEPSIRDNITRKPKVIPWEQRAWKRSVGRYFTVHISIITYLLVFTIDAHI